MEERLTAKLINKSHIEPKSAYVNDLSILKHPTIENTVLVDDGFKYPFRRKLRKDKNGIYINWQNQKLYIDLQ